ncbi:MAG: hypothetical protein GXO77_04810 [Calditrichaeota bacterium]|nr:hypothetical protein [Calditrichota bacterium]
MKKLSLLTLALISFAFLSVFVNSPVNAQEIKETPKYKTQGLHSVKRMNADTKEEQSVKNKDQMQNDAENISLRINKLMKKRPTNTTMMTLGKSMDNMTANLKSMMKQMNALNSDKIFMNDPKMGKSMESMQKNMSDMIKSMDGMMTGFKGFQENAIFKAKKD